MYTAIPAWLALAFVAVGLYALAWSADRFVEGAEAVVGTAGAISPFKDVSPYVFTRDLPVMLLLSLSQSDCSDAISGVCVRSHGTMARACGIVWLATFVVYLIVVVQQETFAE